MVSIPGGTFLMGSPETEIGRDDSEGPLHEVTIQPFFMGKYPVTIAQWNAVVALPQINISLNRYWFDPIDPRNVNQPVDRTSWHQAMEFCARLSKKTGKIYRLPSEAEWEYACRARTTTPFHFGETITATLANYWHNYEHARGESIIVIDIIYKDVGSFPPNAFGLYDMHGNIQQWCADPWHENYHGAPSDRSVWESGGNTEYRVRRGSNCGSTPQKCRSAYREQFAAEAQYTGFRVVCSSAWNP
jgi:formylglycine-generating enzyme required for sulfatase activity